MKITIRHTIKIVVLVIAVGALLLPGSALAVKEPPVKEILASHLGWEVDPVTKGKICTVASGDACQPGKASSQPGGFEYPEDVAGTVGGNVYVTDRGNHRVQELTAKGEFVLMFGKNVNKKGGSLCVKAEESQCRAGEESTDPGAFGSDETVAVEPVSGGDVYVAERLFGVSGGNLTLGERVQKFTPEGRFVLEIGREVNETKTSAIKAKGGTPTQKELEEENLCTQQEVEMNSVKCGGPAQHTLDVTPSVGSGAFDGIGAIAVGGPEGRLYVGEGGDVQEFTAGGIPVSEPAGTISARLLQISPALSSKVSGLAVDAAGDLFVTYQIEVTTNVIRRFDPSGEETELSVSARTEGAQVQVQLIALDAAGRLAVVESENGGGSPPRGTLYEVGAAGLHTITNFKISESPLLGMGFGSTDNLYITSAQPGYELSVYEALPVGELVAGKASCTESSAHESDVTFNCDLNGEVDPWGVSETEVWFEWGKTTSLGQVTTPQQVSNTKSEGEEEAMVKASATIEGLLPNELSKYYYQVASHDHWVKNPEELTSPPPFSKVTTPSVPPRITGEPEASFQTNSSTVLFGELNPENAKTRYAFQYVPYEGYAHEEACTRFEGSCPGFGETSAQESSAYGKIATTMQATGLQPATTYAYRLFGANNKNQQAHDENGNETIPVSTFTTAPAPIPQATTGTASAVGVTTATVSGTVNPDGQPATYTVEFGLYNGPATQYGIVFSGPAGNGTAPINQTLALTGLQPGSTYAYRIKITSGYGTSTGATMTFTTIGLPATLFSPPTPGLLPTPKIKFPTTSKTTVRTTKCKHGYTRNKQGKCTKQKTKHTTKKHAKTTKH